MIGSKIESSYDSSETRMVNKVLKRKILSEFLANDNPKFYGGKYVREFEKKLSKYYKMKYTYNCLLCKLIGCQSNI